MAEDHAIAVALEYEDATLVAVQAVRGTDEDAAKMACIRFAEAVKAVNALPNVDYNRSGQFLTQRGKLSEADWREIAAAIERLADEKSATGVWPAA